MRKKFKVFLKFVMMFIINIIYVNKCFADVIDIDPNTGEPVKSQHSLLELKKEIKGNSLSVNISIIIVIALIAILIGMIIYFLYKNNKNDDVKTDKEN